MKYPITSSYHTNPDNLPQVTEIIKSVLGDDYNYDSTVSTTSFFFYFNTALHL